MQERLPEGHIVIEMDDLNASVDSDNTLFGHMVGKHGPDMSRPSEILLENQMELT